MNDILAVFKTALEQKATDIHFVTGLCPYIKTPGEGFFSLANFSPVAETEIKEFLAKQNFTWLEPFKEKDFSWTLENGYRVRGNVFQTQKGLSWAFRLLPEKIRNFSDIHAPKILPELLQKKAGLILICGATGSGKSTTLAAMVDYLNENKNCHIITIEDPIEYLFENKKAFIEQREIGRDTESYKVAMQNVLRENPDVIILGELRQMETIALSLQAAETGHLVIATMHAKNYESALNRIIDSFREEKQNLIRNILADTLLSVISQQLILKNKEWQGDFEVLVNTNAVKNLIKENKIPQIRTLLQTGANFGMQTFLKEL